MGSRADKKTGEGRELLSGTIQGPRSILITRKHGGLGDIIMTRPLFHQMKRIAPLSHITYVIPTLYHDAVIDIEDIDLLLPWDPHFSTDGWGWHADISSSCLKHEVGFRTRTFLHRSDIWAKTLGLDLKDHSTTFAFSSSEISEAMLKVSRVVGSPNDLFIITPYSADDRRHLSPRLIEAAATWAREHGMTPAILHDKPYASAPEGIPFILDLSMREWMAAYTFAKMAFSTDTSGLHMAGYMKLPGVAVFGYTSGQVLCQHYPTIIPVQVARENLQCVHCYDWSACPFPAEQTDGALRCMHEVRTDDVISALDRALEMPIQPRPWQVRTPSTIKATPVPIFFDPPPPVFFEKPEVVTLDGRGTGRVGVVLMTAIATAITLSMRVGIAATTDSDQNELFSTSPFVVSSNSPTGFVLSIKELMTTDDLLQEVRALVGGVLEITGPGATTDRQSVAKGEELVSGIDFIATSQHITHGDFMIPSDISLRVTLSILRRCAKLVSDDLALSALGLLAGVEVEHVGYCPPWLASLRMIRKH